MLLQRPEIVDGTFSHSECCFNDDHHEVYGEEEEGEEEEDDEEEEWMDNECINKGFSTSIVRSRGWNPRLSAYNFTCCHT